jgi:Mrp family chromosome partitioning ATPase
MPRTPATPVRGPLARGEENALGPYGRAIRRHPRVVVLIALAVVAAAVAWVAMRPVEYQASAQILVTPIAGDSTPGLPILTESVDPTRTLSTAANILTSPTAAAAAAKKGGTTTGDILATTKVEAQGDSNIVGVTATADSKAAAVARADAYAREALDARTESLGRLIDAQLAGVKARRTALGADPDPSTAAALATQESALQSIRDQDPNFSLLQSAQSDVAATGTGPAVIVVLALIIGLALGTGVALLLEQLDRHVRDEDEVLAMSPLPVLARVPLDRRRAQHPEAPPAAAMIEAFRALQIQLAHRGGKDSQVILVTSASEGDGKTTSAITLAETLVAVGKRVILLDFDLRKGDVGRRLGVHADLRRLLRPAARLTTVLEPAPRSRRLQVLSAPAVNDPDAIGQMLSRRLPELIAQAREEADYVVIDTPPVGRVADALRLVVSADDVLLVVRPGNTNRDDLRIAHESFEHLGILPTGLVVVGSRVSRDGTYGHAPQPEPSFVPLPGMAESRNGGTPAAAGGRPRAIS